MFKFICLGFNIECQAEGGGYYDVKVFRDGFPINWDDLSPQCQIEINEDVEFHGFMHDVANDREKREYEAMSMGFYWGNA